MGSALHFMRRVAQGQLQALGQTGRRRDRRDALIQVLREFGILGQCRGSLGAARQTGLDKESFLRVGRAQRKRRDQRQHLLTQCPLRCLLLRCLLLRCLGL